MSLAANDGEGEQNEFRVLQGQVEITQNLVATLSQQLADLKDHVSYKSINYVMINYLIMLFIDD